MKRTRDLIFGIVLCVLTIGVLVSFFIFKDHIPKNSNSTATTYKLDIKNQPTLGDKNAPVTVVEFGDYKCPACGFFANQIFPQLKADYIDKGKIKFIFKDFPFIGVDSARSAAYAEGVYEKLGNDAYWQFHDKLYAQHLSIYGGVQPQQAKVEANEHKDIYTEQFLNNTAKALFGDNANALNSVLKDSSILNKVQKDYNDGQKANVTGTPSVYVNGVKVDNPMNYTDLQSTINQAIGENK